MSRTVEPTEDDEVLDALPVELGPVSRVGALAAWGAIVLVAVLLGWLAWTRLLFPNDQSTLDRFVRGGGITYTSSRDALAAKFPTAPVRRAERGGRGALIEDRLDNGYVFSVSWHTSPTAALEDFHTTLDSAAGALVASLRGEIVTQDPPTAFGTVAVKYLTFRAAGAWHRAALVAAPDRVYTLDVRAPKRPADRVFLAFNKGFRPLFV